VYGDGMQRIRRNEETEILLHEEKKIKKIKKMSRIVTGLKRKEK
jgi:hypothetical protein